MDATLKRLAPLTGVAFVVLYVVGGIIAQGDAPDFADPAGDIKTYYEDEYDSILTGTIISGLAAPFWFWFLGVLRTAISAAEGGANRLANTAFGAGIAAGALSIAGLMLNAMAALRADEDGEISPEVATVMYDSSQILAGAGAPLAAGALAFAVGLASFRHGAVIPKWLGAIAVIIGIVAVIPPISFAAIMAGGIGVLALSGIMFVQRVGDE